MKKSLFLLIALSLFGCARTMDDIIDHEPYFEARVLEVNENNIYVDVSGDYALNDRYDKVYVSLDVEIKDSYSDLSIGDQIYIYYNGTVQETYPALVDQVYAITLYKKYHAK